MLVTVYGPCFGSSLHEHGCTGKAKECECKSGVFVVARASTERKIRQKTSSDVLRPGEDKPCGSSRASGNFDLKNDIFLRLLHNACGFRDWHVRSSIVIRLIHGYCVSTVQGRWEMRVQLPLMPGEFVFFESFKARDLERCFAEIVEFGLIALTLSSVLSWRLLLSGVASSDDIAAGGVLKGEKGA